MVALPAYSVEDESWIRKGRAVYRRDGDEFAFIWPDAGVGIGLENFRESSNGELHAEITVEAIHSGPASHLHLARLNLLSTSSRTTLANALGKRYEADWATFLEQACTITVRDWRRGEPFMDLSEHQYGERPRDLISGFLPFGQPSILFARGGSGKSLVGMGVCGSVISGRALAIGVAPTATGPVMYLDYEADADEQKHRLEAVLKGMGYPAIPHGQFIYRRQQRPIAEDARRIGTEISRKGVVLVIIDSLVPALDGPAIEDGPITRLMNGVRGWGSGVTVLIIAHVNKGDATTKESGPKSIYGNTFAENLARATWEVRKSNDVAEDDGMAVGLFQRKSNRSFMKPIGLRLRMDGDPSWPDAIRFEGWSIDGDDTLNGAQSLGARIIKALRAQGKPMSSDELAAVLDTESNVIRTTAGRLTRAVVNVNPGRGRGHQAMWGLRVVGGDEAPE